LALLAVTAATISWGLFGGGLLAADRALPATSSSSAAPASGKAATAENPAATSATARRPEPPRLPEAPQPTKVEKPKGKTLSTTWYLITDEAEKIGYMNTALYQVEGQDPVCYRLEIRRFFKATSNDTQPGILEESIMQMDKDWTALSFTSNRHGIGTTTVSLEGAVADDKLTVTTTAGAEKRTSTVPVQGQPTFTGAFMMWVGRQDLEAGKMLKRTTIDERNGLFLAVPRMARALKKVEMQQEKEAKREYFVVGEQNGLVVNMNMVLTNGQLHRTDGQNNNLNLQEVAPAETLQMKLEGAVGWQNRVPGKTGDAFSSETFGYRLSLPAYPWLPISGGDGKFLLIDNLLGHDSLHLLVLPTGPGDPAVTAEKMYQGWIQMLGPTQDVASSKTTIDNLPALTYQGKAKVGGCDAQFKIVIVVRGELGFLIGDLQPWPAAAGGPEVFDKFLHSISWTKVFGRERGHWDGQDYVSDSAGFRVHLLANGWRLPEERSGVATNIEAVREDRSGLLTVSFENFGKEGTTLEQAGAAYEALIKKNVPGAGASTRKEAGLDGHPALLFSYEAKALDNEPTESRHLLALDKGQVVVLTLVTKKAALEANLKRFNEAVQSFKFGKPNETTEANH
jgi:hypothetical protein